MAIHSSILAWIIPWTEEPGGLQSMGSQRVWHNWSNLACMHNHPSVQNGEKPQLELRSTNLKGKCSSSGDCDLWGNQSYFWTWFYLDGCSLGTGREGFLIVYTWVTSVATLDVNKSESVVSYLHTFSKTLLPSIAHAKWPCLVVTPGQMITFNPYHWLASHQ